MKVIHRALLDKFRLMTVCAFCGRRVIECDPSHIYSRGAGRVDIPENIVNLCRVCHNDSHAGYEPTRAQLLAIAAKREGTTPEEITAKVHRIRADDRCKVWVVDTEPVHRELTSCALCGAEDRNACGCNDSLPF